MTKAAFTNEIKRMINEAKNKGEVYIDIKAGDLHRAVGGILRSLEKTIVCHYAARQCMI